MIPERDPSAATTTVSTVAVIGLGYVGLPVALACAEAGFQVIGVDADPERVQAVRACEVDGPSVFQLSGAMSTGRLAITGDPAELARAEAVFICVPTPLEEDEARHEAVRACAAAFARHGRPDALVILESTVRPGFVAALRPLLGHDGGVTLAYAPERIDPQRTRQGVRLTEIPRLVAGVDDDARDRAASLLVAMGVAAHPVPLEVAEYAKLLENTYRLVNVAFIDQFAALCRADGVDPRAVIAAAATKPFGFQPFWPGSGAGGHCVAVDPSFLARRGHALGRPLTVLDEALGANVRRPQAIAEAVVGGTRPTETVLAVGLTYKAGVPDLRESAALAAARAITGLGRRVLAFDPLVRTPPDLEAVGLAEGLRRAQAVVVLVPQSKAVTEALTASGLVLFDATGTLPDAVGV